MGAGAFNGFDMVFTGAPTITGVTVDSSTTLSPVLFSFTGHDIKLNLAGLSATAGQKTILDVQTAASLVLLSPPIDHDHGKRPDTVAQHQLAPVIGRSGGVQNLQFRSARNVQLIQHCIPSIRRTRRLRA